MTNVSDWLTELATQRRHQASRVISLKSRIRRLRAAGVDPVEDVEELKFARNRHSVVNRVEWQARLAGMAK